MNNTTAIATGQPMVSDTPAVSGIVSGDDTIQEMTPATQAAPNTETERTLSSRLCPRIDPSSTPKATLETMNQASTGAIGVSVEAWEDRGMLHEKTRTLAAGRNFAVLTTLMPDGTPQSHVMWVAADDDFVYLNTEIDRQKFHNIQRDPRATVTIIDSDNAYSYVEVRGTVVETIGGQAARDDIDALSQRYNGKDYPNPIVSERVILKIRPDREVIH